ncbi:MAG: flippase-like domain-containing protein [Methanocellales archaeon]|nr:flippase-like domain-containing protein [Methanocellales archaeon]
MGKLRRWLTMALAISIGSILLLLILTVDSETLPCLRRIQPIYLFMALTVHVLSWVVWGLRMKVLSGAVGGEVRLWDSTKMVMSNLFAAGITPSHAGGEPVRIHLLSKNGLSIGDATAVVFGERVLDALFLGIAAPISLLLFRSFLGSNIASIFALGEMLFLGALGLMLYTMYRPDKVKHLASYIQKLTSKLVDQKKLEQVSKRVEVEIDNFYSSLWKFVREGKSELLMGLGCTIVIWTLEFTIPSFILMGLGSSPIFVPSFAAQAILTMILMVPLTPGSSGIAEVGASSLYAAFVGSSILGIFVMAWRVIIYHVNLAVGGFVSLSILKDMQLMKEVLEA